MSSIILSNLGSIAGSTIAGPIGSGIGQALGSAVGQEIDQNILFRTKTSPMIGPKLAELTIQTATYGKMIPIIYGKVKLAGNIIWASDIKEEKHDHYKRQSKFGGKSLVASQFTYSISLAIAIGEGEIDEILRIWLNDQLIDPSKAVCRFYNGSEEQMPDPLIEADQGHKKTPAFRGLSYIVIEDLQLAEFGNSIPNFLFEVKRKVKVQYSNGELPLEERIKSMVMIPGSGEFVYDTQVQSKIPKNYNPEYGNFNLQKTKINNNNREGKADSIISLEQLTATCPNLEWVAPVVGWFSTSINSKDCKIFPGVEYKTSCSLPDKWNVAGYNREQAHLISRNKYDSPIYGGTSNDLSILRYLDEIKNRNLKIMFYPMIFVDKSDKPWRGRITGTPKEVEEFFYKDDGYNNFILHYANLVKDKVDAFVIGSELIGLTKIRDKNNKFPAVEALIDLAVKVKSIMGENIKITYAADWSEYHHSDAGWYNLDPLWACNAIDFIGIDAYFPLTNANKTACTEEEIIEGWQSGEGYDYYYSDEKKNNKCSLGADYAWKNISHWWRSKHYNPDGKETAWIPKQKKIWFTEIGFPSVDLATNQPNVFYSPDSIESNFPHNSKGTVDFVAQRQALSATEKYWRNSEFLEKMFIWTWDARPYPYWPDLTKVWSDGGCWSRGHWVNGKLGLIKLEAIIQDLCMRSDLGLEKVRAEQLNDFVDGVVISNLETAKDIINLLKSAYFFDSHEEEGKLFFTKKINSNSIEINEDELVASNNQENFTLSITKFNPYELAHSISVHYLNYLFDYHPAVEFATNYCSSSKQRMSINLPIIIDPQKAKTIADISLQEIWQGQFLYNFVLPPKYLDLKPNDIIYLNIKDEITSMRIINSQLDVAKVNKVSAISIRQNIYHQQAQITAAKQSILTNKNSFDPGFTELLIIKIPILPYELPPYGVYLGVIGNDAHWRGAEVLCPNGQSLCFQQGATSGIIEEDLGDELNITLINGELNSKSSQELERFANLAVIDGEIIQFSNAKFIGGFMYHLTGVKRCLFDSKKGKDNKFILLDNNLQKLAISDYQINKKQEFLVTSFGHNIEESKKYDFIYKGR